MNTSLVTPPSPAGLRAFARSALALLALLTAILITRLESYLLFHALAELTSVAIGAAVFIIAWNSARLEQNNYLLIIGLGLGFVAAIDLLHTLGFKGMEVFPEDDSLGAQLWLAARYVQAIAFLAAPFYLYRPINRQLPVIVFAIITAVLLSSIFVWDIFPKTFMAGSGLTHFKIASEYAIIAAFIAAVAALWYHRAAFDSDLLYMLIGSLVVSIASELAFTLYFGVTDTANLVGHLLKITAFFLLYLALVETAFNRPYDLLFRQLKQEEESQRTGRTQAEAALIESEKRYRGLVDTALVGVYQADLEDNILFANPELARMLQVNSPKDLMGKNFARFYNNPNDHSRLMEILQKDKQTRNFETTLITRDNQTRSVLVSISAGKDTLSGMMRDITENKRAEKEIDLHIQRLHALREIDLTIMSGTNVYISLQTALDQAVRQLGVDAADILVLNPQTQTLKYIIGHGFYSKGIEQSDIKVGQGAVGRAALKQETQHIADLANSDQEFIRANLIKDEGFIDYYAVPLTSKGGSVGVLEVFSRKPQNPDVNWLDFLHAIAGQAAIAIVSNQLLSSLQSANMDLLQAYDATIKGWSHALDLRDKETEGHTLRVAEMTVKLARQAGLSEEDVLNIQRGALLHDIGKMGVPDQILLKPDELTKEEWDIMRKHPQFAFDMLAPIDYLRSALDIPYCHHEKWDGSGYPRGLKGEQIPLAARLFAVVDVWDALRSDRPYRRGWSNEKVIEHIRELSGTHFDPEAVKIFLKVMDESKNIN